MLFNLHTHTHFSDGSSAPEAYLEEANRQGFEILGFSDHSPVPFDNEFAIRKERLGDYVKGIRSLSTSVGAPPPSPPLQGKGDKGGAPGGSKSGGCAVLLALEIDYIPGLTEPIEHYRKNFDFDYFIGSVHLVKKGSNSDLWFIDGPETAIYDRGLKEFFGGDIRKAVTAYYHQINEMIVTQKPDIIGHLDKIKMHNKGRFFREEDGWYLRLVDETLDVIKQSSSIVEVNTRGIYKKRSDSLFPGTEILKKILERNIPVTISTDAHKPVELSLGFEEAKKALIEIGFRTLSVITKTGTDEGPIQ